MIKHIKVAVHGLSNGLGLYSLVANSKWRTNRLLILCYHGVSTTDEHEWSDLYISQEHLRKRFNSIAELNCNVISLDDGVKKLYQGTLPERSIAITFDDGFHDFYHRAYPLLKEFNFPTTVYLTTYYSKFNKPVFDPMINYLLWKGRGETVHFQDLIPEITQTELPIDAVERTAQFTYKIRAFTEANNYTASDKNQLLKIIADRISINYDELCDQRTMCLMNAKELASLDNSLIDIQLHTHRHRTPRDDAKFSNELKQNQEVISEIVPSAAKCRHFCYPSGDYDKMFIPVLQNQGIESATTCDT